MLSSIKLTNDFLGVWKGSCQLVLPKLTHIYTTQVLLFT